MNEEKAILVALDRGDFNVKESLDELELLLSTLNIETVERVVQRRSKPHPAYYLGVGKLEKVRKLAEAFQVTLVVVDDELSPIQAKNIEDFTGLKVQDRTQIILEIFARHATTEEGKIQVELARLQYELPRFVGLGEQLSRLGGGIGTRGPGERILQQRRSQVRKRISVLKKRLEEIETERETQRKKRKEAMIYRVSIVGYTNAGKSSLLNLLSQSEDAKVENKLFATLEPITRRVKLISGRTVLFSDTVGFIRKLPHTIVAAFRATLEEIKDSDLLIHLVDVSDPYFRNKMKESLKVLEEIAALDVPRITVFNKIDLVPKDWLERVMDKFHKAVFMSVKKKIGVSELLERVDHELSKMEEEVTIRVSQEMAGVIYSSLDKVLLLSQEFANGHIEVRLKGRKDLIQELIGKTKGVIMK